MSERALVEARQLADANADVVRQPDELVKDGEPRNIGSDDEQVDLMALDKRREILHPSQPLRQRKDRAFLGLKRDPADRRVGTDPIERQFLVQCDRRCLASDHRDPRGPPDAAARPVGAADGQICGDGTARRQQEAQRQHLCECAGSALTHEGRRHDRAGQQREPGRHAGVRHPRRATGRPRIHVLPLG
jgi:hypothetical protein